MKEFFSYIIESVSFLWTKAETNDDKVIKRYNIVILVCVIFMLAYAGSFIKGLENRHESDAPQIVQTTPNQFDPNYNYYLTISSNTIPPTIVAQQGKDLPADEFYVGEVVGIKYFGIYGLVEEKTLGVNGYIYDVRWKNAERDLPKDTFYGWELFRPPPQSVTLQN